VSEPQLTVEQIRDSLAYEAAVELIESFAVCIVDRSMYDVSPREFEPDNEWMRDAVRYLESRGLILRGDPENPELITVLDQDEPLANTEVRVG
jgi:hypothetical protein